MELDSDNLDLLEIQFLPTDEHQKLLSDILNLKEVILEKNLLIDPQSVPEWIREAFLYVCQMAKEGKKFSGMDICFIHEKIKLDGQFRTPEIEGDKATGVWYGSDYPYFPPEAKEIPVLIQKFEQKYAHFKEKEEPLQMIGEAYFIFELIHPFLDGNGRIGRLICAWMMIQNNYGFLASLLEKHWNSDKQHRIKIFQSFNNNYYGCLGNPEVLQTHFSAFYLYFLDEIKALSKQIVEGKKA